METFLDFYLDISLYLGRSLHVILWSGTVFSLFIFIVFLFMYSSALRGERWLWFLAWSFALSSLASILYINDNQWILMHTTSLLQYLMVLWSARRLRTFGYLQARASRSLIPFFKNIPNIIITEWLITTYFIIAFFFQLYSRNTVPFQRFPESIVGVYCMISFFKAMGTPLKRKNAISAIIRWFCIGLIALFVAGQLLFSLNPYLANLNMGFGFREAFPHLPVLEAMDSLIFVVNIVWNLFFFFVVLILAGYASQVLSPERDILMDISFGNTEYLDPVCKGGLLGAIGRTAGAEYVGLAIRKPGHKKNLVSWWGWFQRDYLNRKVTKDGLKRIYEKTKVNPISLLYSSDEPSAPIFRPMPRPDQAVTGSVLRTGEYRVSNNRHDEEDKTFLESAPNINAYVSVPIIYHGGVVAVLNVESTRKHAFSSTTVRSIRLMARYLAPTIHARRQLEALSLLNTQLAQEVKKDRPMTDLIYAVVDHVHDILEPVATLIFFPFGFRKWIILTYQDTKDKAQKEELYFYVGDGKKEVRDQLEMVDQVHSEHPLEFHFQNLEKLKPEEDESDPLVSRMVLATLPLDPPGNPALGREDFLRSSVTAALHSTIMEGAEARLSGSLSQLQEVLAKKDVDSPKKWFEAIEMTVQENGILWAAARTLRKDQAGFYGSDDLEQTLQGFFKSQPIRSQGRLSVFTGPAAIKDANSLLRIELPESRGELWLGIEADNFSQAFDLDHSPWLKYLDRLASISGYALARIEVEWLQRLTMDLELKSQRAIQHTLWLHELGNKAAELKMGTGVIAERIKAGDLDTALKKLEGLYGSADNLSVLTKEVIRPFKIEDDREEFPLRDAVDQAITFHRAVLDAKKIRVEHAIGRDIQVTISFPIAFLVISNLIGNAIKAIKGPKRLITLQAEPLDREIVCCHVSDTGTGVPVKLRNQIFEPGFSTDPSHSGAGLPVSREVLRNFKGDLFLDEKYSPGARFTIVMPRA
ncbi:MAG: GAF domain-containing sensor histidine kinase [Acidobacteriota bacterium]|nr:GAF domain-containing sensor histidine kinase [Acidobacteriota bacterium]